MRTSPVLRFGLTTGSVAERELATSGWFARPAFRIVAANLHCAVPELPAWAAIQLGQDLVEGEFARTRHGAARARKDGSSAYSDGQVHRCSLPPAAESPASRSPHSDIHLAPFVQELVSIRTSVADPDDFRPGESSRGRVSRPHARGGHGRLAEGIADPLSAAKYRYTVSRWIPYSFASCVFGTPVAAWARSSVTCSAVSEGRRPL